jgi:hypothetical protein
MEIIHEATGMKFKSLSCADGYGIYFPNGKLYQMFVSRRTHKNDTIFENWHTANCCECNKHIRGYYDAPLPECPHIQKYKGKYVEYHIESPYLTYNAAMRRFKDITRLLDKVNANQIKVIA